MDKKPNIIMIFSDQHRGCSMGCCGNSEIITPNFDRFAEKAAVFKNCISNSPVCVPARGSLFTGLLPNRHKAITNDLPVDIGLESIATVMNRNGYYTGYIGKWHLGGIPRDKAIKSGERLGFTGWKACNCNHGYHHGYYYDENNIRTDLEGYEPVAQTELALEFIKENKSDRPWGLVLSYGTPHDPYFDIPDEYLELYKDKSLTLRDNVPEKIMHKTDVYYTREQIAENHKGYYAHITALDIQFGRIIDCLEGTGQIENTIIVYTSDHGDMLGSQGLTNKQLPYFESINVPLMVYWQGKTHAAVSDEIISLVDLPVSLMELAGMSFDSQTDGQDLSGLFTDKNAKGAECAYIMDIVPCHQAYDRGSEEWRGVKTKQYTYARSSNGSFCILFDDIKDEFQLNNLSDMDELRKPLEEKLVSLAEKHDGFLPWDIFIKRYGYLEEWNKSQAHFKLPLLK